MASLMVTFGYLRLGGVGLVGVGRVVGVVITPVLKRTWWQ